jgi:hypothetical protein
LLDDVLGQQTADLIPVGAGEIAEREDGADAEIYAAGTDQSGFCRRITDLSGRNT